MKQPSQDLSNQEVERMVLLSEHMLFLQRKQRAYLLHAANTLQSLQQLQDLLKGFQEPTAAQTLLQQQVNQLPQHFQYWCSGQVLLPALNEHTDHVKCPAQ